MISFGDVDRIRTLFLQCVGLCYAVAFYSLYTQIPGLYGDQGILPAAATLDLTEASSSSLSSLLLSRPTLLWFAPLLGLSVAEAMEAICLVGTLLGLLVVVVPALLTKFSLFSLWLGYLSLYQVGQTFLSFQWDILLLEAGFLAIIAAPLLAGYERTPLPWDHVNMYLVRWLLFRMMLASGCVKLTSGCPTWWGLTAMPTHYFSQCLPTPLSWWTALLPAWLHKMSVAATFVIEIPLTFLFFAPTATLRKFTFFHQFLLMAMIMLTGNYNFFNFLYLGLCLSLADNSWLPSSSSDEKVGRPPSHPATTCLRCLLHLASFGLIGFGVARAFGLRLESDFTVATSVQFSQKDFSGFLAVAVPGGVYVGAVGLGLAGLVSLGRAAGGRGSLLTKLWNCGTVLVYVMVAAGMFGLSLPSYAGQLDRDTYNRIPKLFKTWDRDLGQFHLTSSYGLFRRMTGVGGRPEVVVEGSRRPEGPWTEYHFRYKPGDVSLAPVFCLPHQPRLDWQMWFAALGSYQHNPWFISLVYRLLKGEPAVLDLLDPDSSFVANPATRPKYIRARLYKYTFTSTTSSKAWWERREEAEYLPILSLEDGQLEQIMESQGYLIPPSSEGSRSGLSQLISTCLRFWREKSRVIPPHTQIWSFAWLALPLVKPLFF